MMRTGIIANLFGWQLQDRPLPGWPHYAFLRHDSGIAGAVGTADATTAEVLVYVEVDDPQGVRRQGREARRDRRLTGDVDEAQITIGWLRDPQRNLVGVIPESRRWLMFSRSGSTATD